MNTGKPERFCACGTRLSSRNPGTRCSVCERRHVAESSQPPSLPRGFWERHRALFLRREIGPILTAYRTDPRHGSPISQTQLAGWLGMSQAAVSRIELGSRHPFEKLAEIAATLGMPRELTWFDLPADSAEDAPEVSARELLRLERGQPVGADYVTGLRETVQGLVTLDGFHGGDELTGLAVRTFDEAHAKLASGLFVPSIEHDLESAIAEVGELAGWLAYDADRQEQARRMNLEALTLARLAGDRSMELFVLTNQSMQSLHGGRAREALQIAQACMDSLGPSRRVATLLRVRRARALAQLGDASAALADMDAASSSAADSVTAADPAWAWWITESELAWHRGMLYASLDTWTQAAEWYSRCLDTESTNQQHKRRGRYVYSAYLLMALIQLKDWKRVDDIAQEVYPLAGVVGSNRPAPLLREARTIARLTGCPSSTIDVLAAIEQKLRNRDDNRNDPQP